MGPAPSKDDQQEEKLRLTAESLKVRLKIHQSSVRTFESAMSAQKNAMEILIQTLSAMPRPGECGGGEGNLPLVTAQSLLSNIQKTLSQECMTLNESFKVLENFIFDELEYLLGLKAPMDTENPKFGSLNRDTLGPRSCEMATESEISNLTDPHQQQGSANKPWQGDNRISQKERDTIIKTQDENKKLVELVKEKTYKIKELERQKLDLESQLRRVEKDSRKEIDDIRRDFTKRLRQMEEDKSRLQNTVYSRDFRINELENEKRKMRERRPSVSVQLFYQRKDDLMATVVEELSAMLNTQMSTKNIQLDIIRCESSSTIQQDKPILVLCINASRLGTDAAAAIEGIQRSARTALLIFHHKNVHALPNHPSDRMLTSSEFKSLGGIFDLAFLSGKGIYPCDMNNVAISGIENFIQQNKTN